MVCSSLTHTKDLFILVAKRYQDISSHRWWIVRGNYGNCGNGRSITFHETKLYQQYNHVSQKSTKLNALRRKNI